MLPTLQNMLRHFSLDFSPFPSININYMHPWKTKHDHQVSAKAIQF